MQERQQISRFRIMKAIFKAMCLLVLNGLSSDIGCFPRKTVDIAEENEFQILDISKVTNIIG